MLDLWSNDPEAKCCECGCGLPVYKETHKFVWGHNRCKPDGLTRSKRYKLRHADKVREQNKKYQARKDRPIPPSRSPEARSKEWQRRKARNPGCLRRTTLSNYGLSVADHAALLAGQGGVCGICKCAPKTEKPRALFIDHDHETGAVRGLLCPRCNTTLGHYELMARNPEWLAAMKTYLKE